MPSICPICGIEFFNRRHKNQIYCSRKCGFESQRKPKVICMQCGESFQPKRGKTNPKFCCRSCYEQNRRQTGKKCPQCGKHFVRSQSNAIYCSRKCFRAAQKMPRPKCLFCGKQLGEDVPIEYKFCDKFCRADYSKSQRPSNVCINCGVSFTAIRFTQSSRRYSPNARATTCSDACLHMHMTGINHHAWQGGKAAMNVSVHRGYQWEYIAEKVRVRDKRVCRNCGKTELENGQKMDVHHIIPYHDINDSKKANKMSNLISLCPSCHKKEEYKIRHQQIILPFAKIAQDDRRAARASAQA